VQQLRDQMSALSNLVQKQQEDITALQQALAGQAAKWAGSGTFYRTYREHIL
jgi:hypothetical protein